MKNNEPITKKQNKTSWRQPFRGGFLYSNHLRYYQKNSVRASGYVKAPVRVKRKRTDVDFLWLFKTLCSDRWHVRDIGGCSDYFQAYKDRRLPSRHINPCKHHPSGHLLSCLFPCTCGSRIASTYCIDYNMDAAWKADGGTSNGTDKSSWSSCSVLWMALKLTRWCVFYRRDIWSCLVVSEIIESGGDTNNCQ